MGDKAGMEMKISRETAFCAMQHINALIWQSANKKAANFAAPCEHCDGAISGKCNLDWRRKIKPLSVISGEPIHLMKSEYLQQVGTYPNADS